MDVLESSPVVQDMASPVVQAVPASLQPPPNEQKTPLEIWDSMIAPLRQKLMEAAAKRGESPVRDPLPGYSLELGQDIYGNIQVPELRGRYIAYAFDKHGYLALPKRKGRIKPHWKPERAGLKSLVLAAFAQRFVEAEIKLRAADAKEGKEFEGLSAQELGPLMRKASIETGRDYRQSRAERRRAARNRQKLSRRINRGFIPPNQDRRNCSLGQ